MTTPRIEEMVAKHTSNYHVEMSPKELKTLLTQAYQAGIDEAVEAERNRIKEWVRTQVSDGSGQCIHYEEILETLQDNK